MIDIEVFKAEFSLLLNRFNQQPHELVVKRYYQILNEVMDTQQFKAAALASFVGDDFFPSPQRLIDRVKVSSDDMALVEWDKMIQDVSRGICDYSRYSESAASAFRSIGGLHSIGMADVQKQIPFLKKEFLQLYKTYSLRPVQNLLSSEQSNQLNGSGGLTHVGY